MNPKERIYRNRISTDKLVAYNVQIRETDLLILSEIDLTPDVRKSVYKHRGFIESYIERHPDFLTSLAPVPNDSLAPPIVRHMITASHTVGVGPMAAVAGAIAEYVGNDLLEITRNVIVENGGDIFLMTDFDATIGIYAGNSPLTYKINLLIKAQETPMGVCTSSGTVGHSLSFGRADAVCVLSKSATLADAAATAVGNLVKDNRDIKAALERGIRIEGVLGVAVIIGESFGAIGDVELV